MAKHTLISPALPVLHGACPARLSAVRVLAPGHKYLAGPLALAILCGPSLARLEHGWGHSQARAQAFRFSLRAEPDIITANGISTTSITVQVPGSGGEFSASPIVRFLTSAGSIEPQARVVGGVARALLRSSTTPGTAVVTALIGPSREQVTVEFSSDEVSLARYLQVDGSYVAYNAAGSAITSSGKCALDYGDLRIESDVRLDVDLQSERVWAQGSSGHVMIRNRRSGEVHELRGDRLFYDMARRRGVMRRVDTSLGAARQEFMDSDFRALPQAQAPLPIESASTVAGRPASVASITPAIVAVAPPQLASEPPAASALASPNDGATGAGSGEPQNLVSDASTASALPILPEQGADALADAAGAQTQAAMSQSLPLDAQAASAAATAPVSVTAPVVPSPVMPSMADQVAPDAARAGVEQGASTSGPGGLGSALLGSGSRPAGSLPSGLGGAAGPEEAPLQEVPAYKPLPNAASNAQTSPSAAGEAPAGEAVADGSAASGQAAQGQAREARREEQISEPEPPTSGSYGGYWVTARRIRIFAHDKIQFEKASVYFNGRKLFSMPRYVSSLNGSFNPATDMVAFNSSGGLTLNIPYYYMASARGTGTVYFQRAPGNGFAAESPGLALAVDQQYWLGDKSQGRLTVDQIGHAWNLNWKHEHQFSPTMRGSLYLDMPRHQNTYLRSTLIKDTTSAQLGFEGQISRLAGAAGDSQAQFYARLRPRMVGTSGWSYSVGANLIALRQFARLSSGGSGTGSGGAGTGSGTGSGGTGTGAGAGGAGGAGAGGAGAGGAGAGGAGAGSGSGAGGGGAGGGIGIGSGRPGSGIPGQGPRRLEGEMNQDGGVRPSAMMALVAMRSAQAQQEAASTSVSSTLVGQTLLSTLQSPSTRLWKGATLSGSVLASAFNYSNGRRGIAPGLTLAFQQSLGRAGGLQIDYSFDKGGLSSIGGLYGSSYSNFASANLFLNLGKRATANAYFTRSFSDGAMYGAATLDLYPAQKWRLGLFSDYSRFADIEAYLDYGLSLGRQIGQREVSLNWSRNRGKVYLELGGSPY